MHGYAVREVCPHRAKEDVHSILCQLKNERGREHSADSYIHF